MQCWKNSNSQPAIVEKGGLFWSFLHAVVQLFHVNYWQQQQQLENPSLAVAPATLTTFPPVILNFTYDLESGLDRVKMCQRAIYQGQRSFLRELASVHTYIHTYIHTTDRLLYVDYVIGGNNDDDDDGLITYHKRLRNWTIWAFLMLIAEMQWHDLRAPPRRLSYRSFFRPFLCFALARSWLELKFAPQKTEPIREARI